MSTPSTPLIFTDERDFDVCFNLLVDIVDFGSDLGKWQKNEENYRRWTRDNERRKSFLSGKSLLIFVARVFPPLCHRKIVDNSVGGVLLDES